MQTEPADILSLTVFNRQVWVHCVDTDLRTLLELNYGQLLATPRVPDLVYTVGRLPHGSTNAFFITREGQASLVASSDGELLFLFEKDMTIELQKLRHDLYFVHSAALSFAGQAIMLVGASGSGKSTATWALLHHGYHYLSDELAPVDLRTLEVFPYPHAVCLKQAPPGEYRLPAVTLQTSHALYIPTKALPTKVESQPTHLMAIFFCAYCREAASPALRPLSRAEAATRLFAHALNALAHPGSGLDEAIHIALEIPSFELVTADLGATCALVTTTLEGLPPSSRL